jgi:hypothetical protein
VTFGDASEQTRRERLLDLFAQCPIAEGEMLRNLGLFLVPQVLSRILFMDFLFKQILDVQGVVMEFGCRWGQNMALFNGFRGIYEPFNRLRTIVGFDTFDGFISTCKEDGTSMLPGMYTVTPGYEEYLGQVMGLLEQENPLPHLKKHEIVKGDAAVEIRRYLERNPQTIVALAYFDLDLYEPTRECLLAIRDRLTIGSVIGFDELNDGATPGETLAVKEVLGLSHCALRRFPNNSRASYLVVDHEL